MTRTTRMVMLLGVLLTSANVGNGQSHDFPTLNSIGRYFGAGYTLGGYHSVSSGRLHDGMIQQAALGVGYRPMSPYSQTYTPDRIGGPHPGMLPQAAVVGSCGCAPGAHPSNVPSVHAPQSDSLTPSPAPALKQSNDGVDAESPEMLPPPSQPTTDPDISPSDRRVPEQAANRRDWPIAYRKFPSLASLRRHLPALQPQSTQSASATSTQKPAIQDSPVSHPVNRYRQAQLDQGRAAR